MLVYNEKEQVEQKEIENAEFMEEKKEHWQEKVYGQGLYGKKLVPLVPNLPWNKDSVFRQDPTRERKRTFVLLNRNKNANAIQGGEGAS